MRDQRRESVRRRRLRVASSGTQAKREGLMRAILRRGYEATESRNFLDAKDTGLRLKSQHSMTSRGITASCS